MKCRQCKQDIDNDSLYCKFCGGKQFTERKKKEEIRIPKPRQLKSGNWNIELRKEGISITEETKEKCALKAKMYRTGYIEKEKKIEPITLGKAIDEHIEKIKEEISPNTLNSYLKYRKHRFKEYMAIKIDQIDYQEMIDKEKKKVSPKTVQNAWRLAKSAVKEKGIQPEKIKLPHIIEKEQDFLDYEEIKIFLDKIKGDKAESAALLGLHSLRISEVYNMDKSKIKKGMIIVQGAMVESPNGYVKKETNKNKASRRDVPIMIERLKELNDQEGELLPLSQSNVNRHIKRICEENNLPICTMHDLRRSFASLAYHLGWGIKTTMMVGGWTEEKTVMRIYTKLSLKEKNKDVEKMKEYYQFTNENTNEEKKCQGLGRL